MNKILKNVLTKLFTLSIIAITSVLYLSIFSHFDPFNACYINIDKHSEGNRKTIQEAIKIIKNNEPNLYDDLCKYIDTISEEWCYTSTYTATVEGRAGCYLKGSRIIYLHPHKIPDKYYAVERVETIIKYLGYSKNFWNSR